MLIETKANDKMNLADAMHHVNEAIDGLDIDRAARFRVGVADNGAIILEVGAGNLQRCDIGFTLAQVCFPA